LIVTSFSQKHPEMNDILFTEGTIGPIRLRNRTIRAAAFEGMSPGHFVSDHLVDYHKSVAAGGTGMTTVAYAAVMRSGLSFPHQLWLRPEAIPGLKRLTDAVHREGAAASIQIGHCGNMADWKIAGGRPIAPSGRFNLYGPTFPRAMKEQDIREVVSAFGNAVNLAREAGFDAVEVHAGHGYLVSQFLSPYTNHRKDNYGGSFENRSRFMKEVITAVMSAAGNDMAVLVKMNLRDGFKGGVEIEEAIATARILEKLGVHALVLSGGFVSRAPMYVMRGRMPLRIMSAQVKNPVKKVLIRYFGNYLIKPQPFSEAYFISDAIRIRENVSLPLVFVGGLISRDSIQMVLDKGFEFVSFARALLHDPAFVNKLKNGEITCSGCDQSNYCIAVMYTGEMACHEHVENIPESWKREIKKKPATE
jgi:2,4-dienoyl-CoA reductase-like NADH-dependent reductase (Old Yellow Enzyme family)